LAVYLSFAQGMHCKMFSHFKWACNLAAGCELRSPVLKRVSYTLGRHSYVKKILYGFPSFEALHFKVETIKKKNLLQAIMDE